MAKTSPSREELIETASVIRSMLEHENHMVNYRMTWFSAFQGLLFAALAFVFDKPIAQTIIRPICIVGVAFAILSLWDVFSTTVIQRSLLEWWRRNGEENYDGPPVAGLVPTKLTFFWTQLPARNFMPIAMLTIWVCIFLWNPANA